MDSGRQQNTNIQEQPDKQQALESTQSGVLPKKFRLHLSLSVAGIDIDALKGRVDWRTVARNTFFLLSVLLVIGGLLYWKFYLNGMNMKSLSDGGYTYSFTFSRPAKLDQYSNGMKGYATDTAHSAVVGPVSGIPELCGLRGDPYALAFKVKVYGAIRPVCTTRDSQDEQIYTLSFQAQGQYHEFMITYGYSQDAKVYPKLQTIFESINVSR